MPTTSSCVGRGEVEDVVGDLVTRVAAVLESHELAVARLGQPDRAPLAARCVPTSRPRRSTGDATSLRRDPDQHLAPVGPGGERARTRRR